MPRFNPLSHPICLTYPQWITPSSWIEHVPFAMYLVDLLRPRVLVELGTHYGVSYCAFCQAITELHLRTRAYAIDTWQGDPHNGFYGSNVLDALSTHHQPLYGSFSRLIQHSFDDAIDAFDDGSIDLLHIDGYHTYAAVTHDFETWLPKLSDRAVVLFHDTHVRSGSFGVWKLWEELAQRYPHFSFAHGQGLGVLAVGTAYPPALDELLDADADATALIQQVFYQLGLRLQAHQQLDQQRRTLAEQLQQHQQADQNIPTLDQLVQETSANEIGHWHWLSEYDAYIDALLGHMGRKDVDRLTLQTWAEAWNERIRKSNQQFASFQRWLADAQWQLTEQSLRLVPRAHIGTDPVALCCYFDRVARMFTVGETHFGLPPAARRHMQAETLTLWCYGVEVRLVDGAGLWLCERLRDTLPPEFVARSEPSEVSVTYVVTAAFPPGMNEASEFLLTRDDLAAFATAVDENVYWWLRRDIERTVARRSPLRLFVRAGVVGWRGVAIVVPGHGSIGKSTLVAELVRRGAIYYSDMFAVLDDQGNVHPYRGLIGLGIQGHPSNLRLVREDEPTRPLPIGLIVDGAYTPGVVWRPTVVRGTHAALSLVDSSVLPHDQAAQMQQIAAKVAVGAVALRGPRSEAGEVAALLLDMVDDALVSHALDAAGDNLGRLTDELARVAEIRLRSPDGRAERPPRRLVANRYVRKLNVLPPDDHRRLLQYMLSNQHEVWEARVADPDRRGELHDEIWAMFDRRLRGMLPFVRKQLEVPWFSAGRIEWQLTMHGQGEIAVPHVDKGSAQASGRRISCIYYFHQMPKRFSGGELKLYDTWVMPTGSTAAGTWTTLEPIDNSLVFFPSDAFHEVCPVDAATDAFAGSGFAIKIWFWAAEPTVQDTTIADRMAAADSRLLLPSPAEVRRPLADSHAKRRVAIVVPVYRFPLSHDDQIAIWHLRKYLGEFDRYIIGPHTPPEEFSDFARAPGSGCDFADRATYNRMLMSETFYRAFEGYEYILIYQLDCLVFSNALQAWCQKGFDYIGAPWFERWHQFRDQQSKYPEDIVDGFGTVGNGGFSLRNVSAALEVLTSTKHPLYDRLVQGAIGSSGIGLHEDIFWSFNAPKLVDDFRIPTPREALQFAFETEPRYGYRENGYRLPFGCHGWPVYEREFWEPFLLK